MILQVLMPFSNYQNDTEKVCGVWRRIPREYRRLIREERLQVTLLWERAELAITGQLYRSVTLRQQQLFDYFVLLMTVDIKVGKIPHEHLRRTLKHEILV